MNSGRGRPFAGYVDEGGPSSGEQQQQQQHLTGGDDLNPMMARHAEGEGAVFLATQRTLHLRVGHAASDETGAFHVGVGAQASEPAGRNSQRDPLGSVWSHTYPAQMLVHPGWPDARKRVNAQLGVVATSSRILVVATALSLVAVIGELWLAVAVGLQGGTAGGAAARAFRWITSGDEG